MRGTNVLQGDFVSVSQEPKLDQRNSQHEEMDAEKVEMVVDP